MTGREDVFLVHPTNLTPPSHPDDPNWWETPIGVIVPACFPSTATTFMVGPPIEEREPSTRWETLAYANGFIRVGTWDGDAFLACIPCRVRDRELMSTIYMSVIADL